MDSAVDGGADLCVLERGLDPPRPVDALVLRGEPHRVVRLVPGRPLRHRRERRRVAGWRPVAAVANGGGVREAVQVLPARRRHVPRLTAVRPRRREQDREDDLDARRGGMPDEPVVHRPVVRGVVRVLRVGRLRRRIDRPR